MSFPKLLVQDNAKKRFYEEAERRKFGALRSDIGRNALLRKS